MRALVGEMDALGSDRETRNKANGRSIKVVAGTAHIDRAELSGRRRNRLDLLRSDATPCIFQFPATSLLSAIAAPPLAAAAPSHVGRDAKAAAP